MRFKAIEPNVSLEGYEIPEIPVVHKTTPNHYGTNGWKTFPPDVIVIHATAGGTAMSSVNWLCSSISKASAHFVVPRYPSQHTDLHEDHGPVYQLAPLDVATWHAGRSRYDGRTSISRHSYGIELANWQLLIPMDKDDPTRRFRCSYCSQEVNVKLVERVERNGRVEYWEIFPMEQIVVTARLVNMLLDYIASLRTALDFPKDLPVHIVGHEHVAPGRKVDPGPLFPWSLFQRLVGHDAPFPLIWPSDAV